MSCPCEIGIADPGLIAVQVDAHDKRRFEDVEERWLEELVGRPVHKARQSFAPGWEAVRFGDELHVLEMLGLVQRFPERIDDPNGDAETKKPC
jgi:hypothetical protein